MKPYKPEKTNIIFNDEDNVPVILSYNFCGGEDPSTMFIYWGNKKYKEELWTFTTQRFGKDKVEKYWKNILKLEKNKKLNLDSLCDEIESTFMKNNTQ